MTALVVVLVVAGWVLAGLVIAVTLGRAAKIGDRMMEAQSARWLADKQRQHDHRRSGWT